MYGIIWICINYIQSLQQGKMFSVVDFLTTWSCDTFSTMQHSTVSVHILWLFSAVVLGIRSAASRSPVVWALHLGLRYGSLWGVSKLIAKIASSMLEHWTYTCETCYTLHPVVPTMTIDHITSGCGVGYRLFWLAKGADMVDLVIDIACIYGNGSRLISWYFLKLVKLVTFLPADSKQTTAGTLQMTCCWRLHRIFYSGGWDECQNECPCIIAK